MTAAGAGGAGAGGTWEGLKGATDNSERASQRIAGVVVNYESGPSLTRCIVDLDRAGLRELVVVDNGSTDGSLAAAMAVVPEAEVVRPGGNLGYGAAVNRGVAASRAPLILVCNPDLEVPVDAVAALVEALDGYPGCGLGSITGREKTACKDSKCRGAQRPWIHQKSP